MNLLMLAPEIQEEILFLARAERGRDEMCLRDFQGVTSVVRWADESFDFTAAPQCEQLKLITA